MRRPIDPGRLRTQARLEAAVLAGDGAGGHTESWSLVANVALALEPVAAISGFSADQRREEATHRAVFRRRGDIASGMRFVVRGRALGILAIRDLDGAETFMTALLKEEGR